MCFHASLLGQLVQLLEVVDGWGQQFISFVLYLEVSCFFFGWGGGIGDLSARVAVPPAFAL